MKLIGVIGKKNSGKSTLASILVEKFGFKEFAFADPLKQIIEILFFLEPEYLQDTHLKEQIIEELRVSPRRLMQQIGSDLFRDKLAEVLPDLNLQGHKFWIWHMKMRIEKYIESMEEMGKEPLIVISDVRFEDEAKFVRNFKTTGSGAPMIIEVWRPSLDAAVADIHQSEPQSCIIDKMNADCIIRNEGSLNEFQTQLMFTIVDFFAFNEAT